MLIRFVSVRACLFVSLATLGGFVAPSAHADTVLDYLYSDPASDSVSNLPNDPSSGPYQFAFGETFTVPADNVLKSFVFQTGTVFGGPFDVNYDIYAFDTGTNAITGAALYHTVKTASNADVNLTITPGLALTTGNVYAAVLTSTGSNGSEILYPSLFASDQYPSGVFVSTNFLGDSGLDAKFKADFTGAAVPEPGSVALLLGLSVAGASFHLRRKRK